MNILAVFGRHNYGDPERGEGYEFSNILPDLAAIARETGGEVRLFDSLDRTAFGNFAQLNRALVAEMALFKPDIVFLVLMSYEVWTETLDLVRAHSPAVVVHWGTDDSWKYTQHTRFLAPHVDLHISTDATAVARAARDGFANVALSQWAACGARLQAPIPSAECIHDVSFVGAAYGNRRTWIAELAKHGIEVACFGHGWEGGVVAAAEIPAIVQRSRISLNLADSGLQIIGGRLTRSRQIKARTFEVPGAGGFLLTQTAEGLDHYFELGREIAVFETAGDLAATIRRTLADPAGRDAMVERAHARVVREHTYQARLPALFAQAQARAEARASRPWTLHPGLLDPAVARHKASPAMAATAATLKRIGRLAFGERRGPRAARRAMHELSWRIAKGHTYSAAGWPGRMFYHE